MKNIKTFLFISVFLTVLTVPAFSSAESIDSLRSKISALMQKIAELQKQIDQQTETSQETQPAETTEYTENISCYDFNTNLKIGSTGDDVEALQKILNEEGYSVSETGVFDSATADALSDFQEEYKDEILTPNNLNNGNGFAGTFTRKKLNSLFGCVYPSKTFHLSIKPRKVMLYSEHTFKGKIRNAPKNADVLFYLQRPDGTMKENGTNAGKTDKQGRFAKTIKRKVSSGKTGTYKAWVVVGNMESNIVDIEVEAQRGNPIPSPVPTSTTIPTPWPTPTPNPGDLPPIISGVSGPTTLNVGQIGTWTVKASDPEQGVLSYQVLWGDESTGASAQLAQPLTYYSQTATFTHSYSIVGIYNPTFTVTDNKGLSVKTSISVNVGAVVQPSITVLSPNGGEKWEIGKTYTIKWKTLDYSSSAPVQIGLLDTRYPSAGVKGPGEAIIVNTTNTGSYNWTVPSDFYPYLEGYPSGAQNYKIELFLDGGGDNKYDTSNTPFSIAVATGLFSVSLDPSSPIAKTVAAGSTNVTATVLKLSAVNESVALQQIALQFDGSNLSAITKYTIWDGATKVGEGLFVGTSKTSTAVFPIFPSQIIIPKDGYKLLTIKVDLAQVGTGQPAQSGDTIAINYDGDNWQNTKGIGQSSGTTISSSAKIDTMASKITLEAAAWNVVQSPQLNQMANSLESARVILQNLLNTLRNLSI